MADKETIDSQEQVDEGMKDVIRLGTLLTLLAVPGLASAKDLAKNLPKTNVTATDVKASMDKINTVEPKYGGFNIFDAANIVAKTLFYEARGEGKEGIDAVASVLYNRAGGKAENLPTVCLAPKQFSYWNDKKVNEKYYENTVPFSASKPGKDREMWLYCQKISGQLIFNEFKSTIGNLNSYYAHNKVTPDWADKLKDTKKVNNHTFGYLEDQNGFAHPIGQKKKNVYTVKKGDTLSKIAAANKTTTEKLISLNPKINNPDKISVGMKLKLPT